MDQNEAPSNKKAGREKKEREMRPRLFEVETAVLFVSRIISNVHKLEGTTDPVTATALAQQVADDIESLEIFIEDNHIGIPF